MLVLPGAQGRQHPTLIPAQASESSKAPCADQLSQRSHLPLAQAAKDTGKGEASQDTEASRPWDPTGYSGFQKVLLTGAESSGQTGIS